MRTTLARCVAVLAAALATGAGLAAPGWAGTGSTSTATATTAPAQPPTVPPLPAGVPLPPTPAGLPADIEALAPYVPQDSCDPVPQPGVLAFAKLLTATYPDTSVVGTGYACGTDGSVSEHYEGRALDWGAAVSNAHQSAEVAAVLHWLLAPDAAGHPAALARRLGVMYIIWNAHILGTYRLADGWRPYACSGVTACHQDHVHFSFGWAGARGVTSFWTGRVAPTDYGPCRVSGLALAPPAAAANPAPCPSPSGSWPAPQPGDPAYLPALRAWSGALLRSGSTGPAVRPVQAELGVSVDGGFGPITAAALQAFQRAHGLAPSAVTDVATWRALLAAASSAPPAPTPAGFATVCPAGATAPFTDLAGDPDSAAVACLYTLGVVAGFDAQHFGPAATVDRGQVAALLARLLTVAHVSLPAAPPAPFGDVAAGSTFAAAIDQLAALGVVHGLSATQFDPLAPVDRAQLAMLLARAWQVVAGHPLAPGGTDPYDDVPAGAVATPAVLAVSAAGISVGETPTHYGSADPVRRDQMAELLARTLGTLPATGS